jgi:regulator of PEP synthase PpsR (kinase-PPPase family)
MAPGVTMPDGADESREGRTLTGAAPVYLVSDGTGASGGMLLGTVLAQFPSVQVPIEKRAQVRTVGAIEFTVTHDDSRRPEDLAIADQVLLGISCCAKTPLSMYLAVHRWKVANLTLVSGLPWPEKLTTLELSVLSAPRSGVPRLHAGSG